MNYFDFLGLDITWLIIIFTKKYYTLSLVCKNFYKIINNKKEYIALELHRKKYLPILNELPKICYTRIKWLNEHEICRFVFYNTFHKSICYDPKCPDKIIYSFKYAYTDEKVHVKIYLLQADKIFYKYMGINQTLYIDNVDHLITSDIEKIYKYIKDNPHDESIKPVEHTYSFYDILIKK